MKNIAFFGLLTFLLIIQCAPRSATQNLMASNAKLHLISDHFSFTEGPAADAFGNVFFTDQPNDRIFEWRWKDDSIKEFSAKTGRANGTYFDNNGFLVTCSDNEGEIWKFSKDGKAEVLLTDVDGKRLNGPNDLWLDRQGGIYFTDPLYERTYWKNFKQEIPEKNLYYRSADGKVTKIDTFVQPNGIVGSEKLGKLYVSDIDAQKTYVYDLGTPGKPGNKKLFCEMGSDGMTIDSEGNLYITGDGVTVFNANGKKILHIPVPEKWTANVTFGGKDFRTLFITASKSVYSLKMNVSGVK